MFCCGGSAAHALPPAPLHLRAAAAPDEFYTPDPLLQIYGAPALVPPLHLVPSAHLTVPRSREPFTGILTPRQASCLLRSLPPSLRPVRWFRAYRLVEHGASLSTLLRRSRGLSPTVLALRTAEGVVMGAFCPSPWWDAHPAKLGQHADMPPHVEGSSFFGYGGGAFVFSFAAAAGLGGGGAAAAHPDTPGFATSAWRAGLPHQLQYLHVEPKKGSGGVATRLGVGGGGESFALLLDEALERGLSGRCAAFESGSLLGAAGGGDGAFVAVDVELWAFGERDPEVVRSPSLFAEEAGTQERPDAPIQCGGGGGEKCPAAI